MRLYLSSYQLGDRSDVLRRLVRGSSTGWVISNALDGYNEDYRSGDSGRQIAMLATVGLTARDLDLRRLDPSTIAAAVGNPDFIWVRGGNTFTLRMAMARSGMDQLLIDGLLDDAFAYGGFSAGACIMAPSLAGIELCDPVEECVAEYGEVRYDGLGLIDRPVVPHLDTPGHPEGDIVSRIAQRYDAAQQPYWGLRDGQALVVSGAAITVM